MAAFSLLSLFHPNPSIPKMTTKPLAVLNKAYKMQVPYELKQGQTRIFHQLPSGLNMEVIEQKGRVLADKENNRSPGNSEKNPPLVFVHGSYHAAWCWAEHWLPFFSGFGFDSYAVSLLGQVCVFPFSLPQMFDFWILGFSIIVIISVLNVPFSWKFDTIS